MKKQDVKKLKEIAARLPVMYEQTVSGYTLVPDESLASNEDMVKYPKKVPNIVNHPVNHVRRMRKAYESRGMDGVRDYLDFIRRAQENRRELAGLRNPEGENVH